MIQNFYFWEIDYDDGKSTDFNEAVSMEYGGSKKQPNASLYIHKPVRPGK